MSVILRAQGILIDGAGDGSGTATGTDQTTGVLLRTDPADGQTLLFGNERIVTQPITTSSDMIPVAPVTQQSVQTQISTSIAASKSLSDNSSTWFLIGPASFVPSITGVNSELDMGVLAITPGTFVRTGDTIAFTILVNFSYSDTSLTGQMTNQLTFSFFGVPFHRVNMSSQTNATQTTPAVENVFTFSGQISNVVDTPNSHLLFAIFGVVFNDPTIVTYPLLSPLTRDYTSPLDAAGSGKLTLALRVDGIASGATFTFGVSTQSQLLYCPNFPLENIYKLSILNTTISSNNFKFGANVTLSTDYGGGVTTKLLPNRTVYANVPGIGVLSGVTDQNGVAAISGNFSNSAHFPISGTETVLFAYNTVAVPMFTTSDVVLVSRSVTITYSTITRANITQIVITGNTTNTLLLPAAPYPSTITISNSDVPSGSTVASVRCTLVGLQHTFISDVNIMLVHNAASSSASNNTLLMHNVADGTADNENGDATVVVGTLGMGIDITFDDYAPSLIPSAQTGPNPVSIMSGASYRPTNNLTLDLYPPTTFPASTVTGAPLIPINPVAAMSNFNGMPVAGDWSLYVTDVGAGANGNIFGGWSIAIDYV